ncbi:succinate dehydrogenase subunit 5, mitochondrial-like [Chenopodium quinoa]|uniref:succinate dehydrogenase subunit 5, mitochondrial-like n=1 Tax=Chenopodium quinoa TaxID=63459 RepID=UPI000B78A05F|nr:succinate dehydrogenase subunit 5, mitochondrial-like [Chenopodium quinoa]
MLRVAARRLSSLSSSSWRPVLSHHHQSSRSFFNLSPRSSSTPFYHISSSDRRSPFGLAFGSIRSFSKDVAPLPDIKDSEIKAVFKDFMAADWGELPSSLIKDAKKVLSKDSDDKVGKEALKSIFRAAEASEEFIGCLETFKMAIDDLVGMSGENVKPLPEHYAQALKTAYDRYSKYLDSFGPDEVYLKKKVESELGRRMIHLKMRCGGLDSQWGKVTVLGTSGISGSYVEQRAP